MLLAIVWFARQGFAYEADTHAAISARAVQASVLSDQRVLNDIGLQLPISDDRQQFPNGRGDSRNIIDLFQDGARFEDSLFRPANHFYDPLSGQGVSGFSTSPDWAVDGTGDPSTTKFSFLAARQYMFAALTDRSASYRREQFGLMFRSLGHVIHHIQDMAQPQHTRLDLHCDIFPCRLAGTYAPSLFEQYTNLANIGENLLFTGYAPVYGAGDTQTFSDVRKFWHTPDGKGMADYSNRGFVSAGTNFDRPGPFPSPALSLATAEDNDIQVLCADEAAKGRFCPNPSLTGSITFYGTNVEDRLRPSTGTFNHRSSSYSVFDPDLKRAGRAPVFSLNRFNFYAAHDLLVPRAVGYSAGLLNYFFRGKIDLVRDPADPVKYLIKNFGTEPLKGTFALYYDDETGNRHSVPGARWVDVSLAVESAGADAQYAVSFTPPTDPAPKIAGEYMLVFQGEMGEERPDEARGIIGAVVAKHVGPVYGGTLYVLGLDAANRPVSLKVDARGTHLVSGYDAQGTYRAATEFDPLTPVAAATGWYPGEGTVLLKQAKITERAGVSTHEPIAVSIEAYADQYRTFSYVKDRSTGQWSGRALPTWLADPDPALGEYEFALSFAGGRTANASIQYRRKYAESGQEKVATGAVAGASGLNFNTGQIFVSGDGKRAGEVKDPLGGTYPNDASAFSDIVLALAAEPHAGKERTQELRNASSASFVTPECVMEAIPDGNLWMNCEVNLPPAYVPRHRNGSAAGEILTRQTLGAVGGEKKVITQVFKNSTVSEFSSLRRFHVYSPCQDYAEWHSSERTRSVYTVMLTDGAVEAANDGFVRAYSSDGVIETSCASPATGKYQITYPSNLGWTGNNVVWTVGDKAADVVYWVAGAWDRYYFRGKPFPLNETPVYDFSPVGEVFFASSDLTVVEHEPRLGMKRIELPPHVRRIIGALWL
jgi:hypothetical protein